tara:strand:+ start:1606 stop:2085 length:480 start_codon:yes stop_codon:yes gene_type:complete
MNENIMCFIGGSVALLSFYMYNSSKKSDDGLSYFNNNDSKSVIDFMKQLKLKLSKNNKVIIVIYANWCGYCKRLLPELNEISYKNKNNLITLDVAEHPIENIPELSSLSNEITGYPSIFIAEENDEGINIGKKKCKLMRYENERDAENLLREIGVLMNK